jgi:hypothetical protein
VALTESGHVFSHDGPVPINPTPTVDDNSAAAANKQRWRLPGFGCIALAFRLPLIALERLVLQGSEWRISIGGIVAVPVLLACLVLLILQQS